MEFLQYKKYILIIMMFLMPILYLDADFFEIDFSNKEIAIINENPSQKYIYLPNEISESLKNVLQDEHLNKTEQFKSFCESVNCKKIALKDELVKFLDEILESNKTLESDDLSELEDYLDEVKDDEFRIFSTDEAFEDFDMQTTTKGKKRHVKVVKKCAYFKKDVEFSCDSKLTSMAVKSLVVDGIAIPILSIHNATRNNEMEYGTLLSPTGTATVTFATPFQDVPSVIIIGNVTQVTTTGFTVTGLNINDPIGWLALGALS